MGFEDEPETMQGFYNKKSKKDMQFFSRGRYTTSEPAKQTAKDWICKQCQHSIPVIRKGGKLTTNPPISCEMCGHTTFTLQTEE